MPLFGIEVSKYNGNINHAAAKNAGVRFAIVAASVGECGDSRFESNVNGFHTAHVPVGACHTLTATSVHDTLREACFFIDTITPYRDRLTLPPVCRVDTEGVTPHLTNVFIKCVKDAGFDACAVSDGTDALCDGAPMIHTHTRTGQLVGVVGEFACAFGYAPISRPIIKSRTDITDDVLDYIERHERGEYIIARLADMIVAKTVKPLANASYERIVPLIRLSCRLSVEDMAHLCSYSDGVELLRELYSAMVR